MKSRGTRLGSFEIHGLIGVGGMGEVYRARDTRLGRDVAIKLLPAAITADSDRHSRFEREARLLASLNHPHIAAVYGLEESPDGTRALVLELVEGPTLAERLRRGALPVADALAIGGQVADALAAAHDLGIVHRDLKPQNIKLKPDNTVKVLDFGLAKALARGPDSTFDELDLSLPPTATSGDLTHAGTVLGTPAYMSPEQTRGREVDRRADVWAFGCVLYELLTGRRAFPGDDVPETIAAVLRGEPDWSALPADVPPSVQNLLRRCLEKDPARRLRDIGDVRILIEDSIPARPAAPARETAAAPRKLRPLVAVAGLAVVVLTVAGVALYSRSLPDAASAVPAAPPPSTPAAAATAPRPADVERLPNSIAVLPLDNLSTDREDAYFAVGLHEEILNQLAKLRNLSVISRTSVLRYAENRPPIPEIAEQLRVTAVMEGSVRYAGNQLMVTAQLIDPATDLHIWSETFRAERGNVDELFAIQVDIATAIAIALGAEITTEDRGRIERMPTESAGAYARYLRATDYTTRMQFADAVRELNAAINDDPAFAEAYAQRGYIYAYAQVTSNSRSQLLRDERLRNSDFQALALADAARALELYDGAGLAWVARAVTELFRLNYRAADEAFARALASSPNDPRILSEYAQLRMYQGNLADAFSLTEQAERFDPDGPLTLGYRAFVELAAGRVADAAATLERALQSDPTNVSNNMAAARVVADPARAEQYARTAAEFAEATNAGWALQGLAAAYQRIGLEQEAAAALDAYAEWAERFELGAAEWAQHHLLRGETDLAYTRLEEAVMKLERGETDAGFFALQASFLGAFGAPLDPRLAEPRFQRLLDRLKALTER